LAEPQVLAGQVRFGADNLLNSARQTLSDLMQFGRSPTRSCKSTIESYISASLSEARRQWLSIDKNLVAKLGSPDQSSAFLLTGSISQILPPYTKAQFNRTRQSVS